ncbi:MAG: hypothetical protein ACLSHX_17920 [Suilimivivens sp.]
MQNGKYIRGNWSDQLEKLSQIHWKTDGKKNMQNCIDDETEIELSQQKWKRVVECGLKCVGFVENQELKAWS